MGRRPVRLAMLGWVTLVGMGIGPNVAAGCPDAAAVVHVSVANDEIQVPEEEREVKIYLEPAHGKSKVCWVVSDLGEGYVLALDRKSTTEGTGYFPDLKKKFKGSSGKPVIERVGVPKRKGDWHYAIRLKKDGSTVDELDPTIIILVGGG